jgi:site-specific recombinase XerD
MRNLETRNFNLGSRDMELGLKNALVERGLAYETVDSYQSHISQFVTHLKSEGVKDLRSIKIDHVKGFADTLHEKIDAGALSHSSAATVLSAINSAMSTARQDNQVKVTPKEAGLPGRNGIATVDSSIPTSKHQYACSIVSERLSAQLDMQRALGLRFKESSLINARGALSMAERTNSVTISLGTKGGKNRTINSLSLRQIETLRTAANIQSRDRSMIPNGQSWAQYQNNAYQEIKNTGLKFHGERHTFANDKYEKLTGVKSPIRAGVTHGKSHIQYIAKEKGISYQAAKEFDINARLQISHELGHGRTSITNAYLG